MFPMYICRFKHRGHTLTICQIMWSNFTRLVQNYMTRANPLIGYIRQYIVINYEQQKNIVGTKPQT